VEHGPVDVRPAVSEALDQVRHAAEERGVSVSASLPPGPAVVDGDRTRLVQVVGNLLGNAVEFTPRDGRVAVAVEAGADTVTVEVSDTGPGIPAEALPHIFDRFRQAGEPAGGRGLGLGLAIVRTLVELHGGRVEVASDGPGRGARFVVTLPGSLALPRPGHPEATPGRPRRAEGLRVLLVEDEADGLEMLATLLESHGLEVTAVDSFDAALAAWGAARFDAVVSDIRMPGRDGHALIEEIRRRENGTRVRAVAVSANAAAQDRERAYAAGFDVHLAKPVVPDDLLAALARRMTSGRRAGRRGEAAVPDLSRGRRMRARCGGPRGATGRCA
jgi:CheY-like chemotaxis protein/anti-sigma regulatory factor (Ser/Thr protein kinase)